VGGNKKNTLSDPILEKTVGGNKKNALSDPILEKTMGEMKKSVAIHPKEIIEETLMG